MRTKLLTLLTSWGQQQVNKKPPYMGWKRRFVVVVDLVDLVDLVYKATAAEGVTE